MGFPRLGLSVSKKVGNAVTRNTVRRRLRELFHEVREEDLGSRDIVVSARPAAASAEYGELRSEFLRSIGKLGENGPSAKASVGRDKG